MLNDKQDAYGHQLYDCFRGQNVVEVVERDDGFIDSSTSLPKYYLAEYKDWRPHEKGRNAIRERENTRHWMRGRKNLPLFPKERLGRSWN